jgi:hypothetical protein
MRVVPRNTYVVETLDGRLLHKALNGKYLKQFHPSVWHGAQKVLQWPRDQCFGT